MASAGESAIPRWWILLFLLLALLVGIGTIRFLGGSLLGS